MTQARQRGSLGRWGCGIALLLLLIALALAPGATPVAASTVTVRMLSGHLFQPVNITIRPGTTVTWINKDAFEDHNVAEAIGVFGIGSLAFDQSYSYTFPQDASGTYNYSCTFHFGMDGSVTILNTTPTATATATPIPNPPRHANAAVATVTATSVPMPPAHIAVPTGANVNTPRAQPARH